MTPTNGAFIGHKEDGVYKIRCSFLINLSLVHYRPIQIIDLHILNSNILLTSAFQYFLYPLHGIIFTPITFMKKSVQFQRFSSSMYYIFVINRIYDIPKEYSDDSLLLV